MAKRGQVIAMPREHKRPKANRLPSRQEATVRSVDRDPELDQVLELLLQSPKSWARISEESGVARATIRNWELGRTKRPQNVTIKFVMRAIGYERGPWKPVGGS